MADGIVIIGGGLAGLTATILLAQAGLKVSLYERATEFGGRGRSRCRNGIVFNQGPHALYIGGVAFQTFKELGLDIPGSAPSLQSNWLIDQSRLYPIPADLKRFVLPGWFSIREKLSLLRALKSTRTTEWRTFSDMSFREWLDRQALPDKVVLFLLALCRLSSYSHPPEMMSADAALSQLRQSSRGVLYVDGGWQHMVDQLSAKARALGVHIVTETPVRRVQHNTHTALGIELQDGSEIKGGIIIAAMPPKDLINLLDGQTREKLERWHQHQAPARLASLDVALSKLPNHKVQFALGIDKPWYFSVHSRAARLSSQGEVVLHAGRYIGPEDSLEAQNLMNELVSLMDLVQPGWEQYVIEERFMPGMIAANMIPTPDQGGLAGRPTVQLTDLDNLYAIGDWIGPEGLLLDASIASVLQMVNVVKNRVPMDGTLSDVSINPVPANA